MKNPFTQIPDNQKDKIINQWLEADAIENIESAMYLVGYDTEWKMYTLGQSKNLAQIAGFDIQVDGINLEEILHSKIVLDEYETDWINKIKNQEELYIDIFLGYIDSINGKSNDYIKIV